MRRREFLQSAVGSLGTLAVAGHSWAASQVYPHATLAQALAQARFNPGAAGHALFVVAADTHYGTCQPAGLLPVIEQVNAMRPRPAFFLVNGDLITTASIHFGHRPNAAQRQKAIDEFKLFRRHVERLHPQIPLKLSLGNHDTYPGELKPELFAQVFPEHPPYQAFELAGLPILILNGHSDGFLDSAQTDWLIDRASHLDRDAEAAVFVHQPSLGSVANERGIAPSIQAAFEKHRGPLWAICGHVHRNSREVFALANTTIAQISQVCSAEGIWGGPEKPGYWIYGVAQGRIACRIFRRLGHGYRVAGDISRADPQPISKPFEHARDVLWKILVGEGDRPHLVRAEAADVETFWFYVKQLTYRLPLAACPGAPRRFGVLGHLGTGKEGQPSRVAVSADNESWQDLTLPSKAHQVYEFEIPEALRQADSLYVRIEGEAGTGIAGYCLMG